MHAPPPHLGQGDHPPRDKPEPRHIGKQYPRPGPLETPGRPEQSQIKKQDHPDNDHGDRDIQPRPRNALRLDQRPQRGPHRADDRGTAHGRAGHGIDRMRHGIFHRQTVPLLQQALIHHDLQVVLVLGVLQQENPTYPPLGIHSSRHRGGPRKARERLGVGPRHDRPAKQTTILPNHSPHSGRIAVRLESLRIGEQIPDTLQANGRSHLLRRLRTGMLTQPDDGDHPTEQKQRTEPAITQTKSHGKLRNGLRGDGRTPRPNEKAECTPTYTASHPHPPICQGCFVLGAAQDGKPEPSSTLHPPVSRTRLASTQRSARLAFRQT